MISAHAGPFARGQKIIGPERVPGRETTSSLGVERMGQTFFRGGRGILERSKSAGNAHFCTDPGTGLYPGTRKPEVRCPLRQLSHESPGTTRFDHRSIPLDNKPCPICSAAQFLFRRRRALGEVGPFALPIPREDIIFGSRRERTISLHGGEKR